MGLASGWMDGLWRRRIGELVPTWKLRHSPFSAVVLSCLRIMVVLVMIEKRGSFSVCLLLSFTPPEPPPFPSSFDALHCLRFFLLRLNCSFFLIFFITTASCFMVLVCLSGAFFPGREAKFK